MKKIILALALLMVLSCAPLPVFAAEAIDTDSANGTLTVSLMDGNSPVSGVPVHIWKVADISGTTGSMRYSVAEKFADYDFSFDFKTEQDWISLLQTLAGRYAGMRLIESGIIQNDRIADDSAARSDANGKAVFSGLKAGLYLVIMSTHSDGKYNYVYYPALITIPYPENPEEESSNWKWTYNVTIVPKHDKEPISTPDTDPPDTNPPDTNPPDTNPPDTNPPDTNPPDTNPPSDVVPDVTPPVEIPSEDIPLVFPPVIPEESVPEENVPEEEIPLIPMIPKSGLLWWPVPVLGVGGIGMITGGAILRKNGKDDD
jgi:hypothetical protein